MIQLIICDDHMPIRQIIQFLFKKDKNIAVIAECINGKDLIDTLNKKIIPHIVLMDISMKELNGYETTLKITKEFPQIKVLAYSMFYTTQSIQMMIKSGAVGFLSKNEELDEIKKAIIQTHTNGFYENHLLTKQLFAKNKVKVENIFTKKEYELLPYLCSDASYKAIADEKNVAVKTIDRHKENICKKMNVKTRAGLTTLAAKMGLIT